MSNSRDEYGRLLRTGVEEWEDVCRCRCDSNSDKVFVSENGETYRPNYHVVCEGRVDIANGDYVRCIGDDGLRGEGKVTNRNRLNYLPYTERWM